ncbi:WecB/TagA/CpsF family glycosyltransferase [Galbibacter pacificus]|uniref:WecB/TagA/CpsF family glycosyltransferase n=1 Tax=Galbibacter pacificus TaxID=2996052 RepID=A0ABT6FNV9_9FLAO|nr:WecB/TagA/CpsF family glycosyltransferase [Galbibacter pacificus]MDG3581303.1 WecB/TagA/CpsF family glycosyltransferase [Galbibacter pacificus]MDG3584781.1 WecB/TagA/CpsF family glycosyltransferase [Galbibacter pacificus]
MEVISKDINNKRIYAFKSKDVFLHFIKDKKSILIALNAEKLNKADQELDKIINNNIGYPDGIGAVLALKRKGVESIKIAGAEFWLDIIKKYQTKKSFYLIGGSKEVIEKTIVKLYEDYPSININGYRDGYLKDGYEAALLEDIVKTKPDVIFVAMGSPKQEFLMEKYLKVYPALYMGLGGSFDVYTGKIKRAPKIYQNLGLEWFYRLLKEPTRWRRQLTYINFSIRLMLNKI